MVNIVLSPTLSTGMSPSSATSNFCGLPRPSISHSHSKSHEPISDASSTTSSKFRKQLVANARPLLLRRRDSTNTTHSIPSLNNKSKLSTSTSTSTSYENHTSSSTSPIPPSRNLKLKKSQPPYTNSPNFSLPLNNSNNPKRKSTEFQWGARRSIECDSRILGMKHEVSVATRPIPTLPIPLQSPKPHLSRFQKPSKEILSPTSTSTSSPPYSSYSRNTESVENTGNNTGISTTTSTSTSAPAKPPNLVRSEQPTLDLEENSRDIKENLAPQEQIDYTSSALGIRMASSVGSERGTPEVIPRPIAHPPKDWPPEGQRSVIYKAFF
ncbi:predicted protein [Sclerotinia sclerotiorum 1980 UF-70]|uniref:Uncharacterized protein n=1 Tax=Sclerotinia sclerotiorum (strain ATCC 18683 / 1980 / Ss-1) TaxID=665079 RepID=A7F9A8_SCLS1|nr:predicted protein [Sclerotinia sclerotiorum 1980 UF-70]EDO00319.1 predicted protein [Sclerotinia sclerotiorum 1980 UF-70]